MKDDPLRKQRVEAVLIKTNEAKMLSPDELSAVIDYLNGHDSQLFEVIYWEYVENEKRLKKEEPHGIR